MERRRKQYLHLPYVTKDRSRYGWNRPPKINKKKSKKETRRRKAVRKLTRRMKEVGASTPQGAREEEEEEEEIRDTNGRNLGASGETKKKKEITDDTELAIVEKLSQYTYRPTFPSVF